MLMGAKMSTNSHHHFARDGRGGKGAEGKKYEKGEGGGERWGMGGREKRVKGWEVGRRDVGKKGEV